MNKRIAFKDLGLVENPWKKDRGVPEYGKQYALTGATGTKSIANGNTWKESEVRDNKK
jgi:hypothetical protein